MAEEYWRTDCGYLGYTVPSGIVCSTAPSSSADVQFTETSEPEPSSSLSPSNRSNSGTSTSSDALALKLGLGLGIGLGVLLLVAAIYIVHLQRTKLNRQGPSNDKVHQVSSYPASRSQGLPPSDPLSSHTSQSCPVPSSPPQVQSQQQPPASYKCEHGGGAGSAGGNMYGHEILRNIRPSRHELPSNNSQSYAELPSDARPHNELP